MNKIDLQSRSVEDLADQALDVMREAKALAEAVSLHLGEIITLSEPSQIDGSSKYRLDQILKLASTADALSRFQEKHLETQEALLNEIEGRPVRRAA